MRTAGVNTGARSAGSDEGGGGAAGGGGGADGALPAPPPVVIQKRVKWSNCKHCGKRVERTIEAMDEHSDVCADTQRAQKLHGQVLTDC